MDSRDLRKIAEAYTLTQADKTGNTKAWQDRDKKNVKTGEPLYTKADHLKKEELEATGLFSTEEIEAIIEANIIENERLANAAYARAKELGQKRRNSREHKKHGSSVGKNERAGYNLSQSQSSVDTDAASQRGAQTGGGPRHYGFKRHTKNPVKSKSIGDTGVQGHRKKRDEKITMKKDGKTPLKTPRYKLSSKQRDDHHSSRRYELKNPKTNPKHTDNTKK